VKSIGKRALVILGSSLFGVVLWLAIFATVIVGSANLYKPQNIVPDELLVFGGGFLLAGALGVSGAVYVLRRFSPRANLK
jgi:hypothetical protein